MNFLKFALYYLGLRLKILLGISQTAHSLNIKWRWRYWLQKQKFKNRTRSDSVLRNDVKKLWRKIFH